MVSLAAAASSPKDSHDVEAGDEESDSAEPQHD
jgi:hypothetical protein